MDNVRELTSEQTEKLLQFQEMTGIEHVQRCVDILHVHEWNIEAAVQDEFNEREGAPTVFFRPILQEDRAPLVVLRPSNQRVYLYPRQRPQSYFEWTYCLLMMPVHFVWTTVIDILQVFFNVIRPEHRRSVAGPVEDVTSFISSFESKYGYHHPVFYQGTYSQALTDAKRELRFLLVYLHNDSHLNTDQFCRDILCNEALIHFINSSMLFWACSTDKHEGAQVSQALRDHAHPFLAVIVLRGSSMSVVGRLEGHIAGPQELMDRLQQIMAENEPSLATVRAERAERSFNQSLRQEQDEAYKESLLADQEKDKRKREDRDKLMVEEKRRQQDKEDRELQFLVREQKKSELERLLPLEPEAEHPDSIRVILKIPNGCRIERRFLRSQSLKWLYYFTFCHKECPDDFQIITNYPRRCLPCEPKDGEKDPPSFHEVGLGRSEVLFVHDNQT